MSSALNVRGNPRHLKPLALAAGLVMWAGADPATVATDVQLSWGTGAPNHTAPQGSVYIRTNAADSDTLFYRNTDGATTWETVLGSELTDMLATANAWTAAQTFQNVLLGAVSELTIASGAVAATRSYHTLDTEGDAASDDLDDITGLGDGELLLVRPASAARTVVLRHAVGANKIATPGARNISLAEGTDWAILVGDGTQAVVLAASTLADGFLAAANTYTGLQTFAHASGIATDTITERTAAAGVTIDGLKIKDSALAPAAGATAIIDLSSVGSGEADVSMKDNLADAFTFREAANAYLTFVTTDAAEAVVLGKPLTLAVGASTAAAGSATGDAGVLPAGTASVYPTTAADGTKGVRVNAADQVTGRMIWIGNGVSNQILKVYPPSGGTINGAAGDAAFSSASGKGVLIVCLSSGSNTWLAW